MLWDLTRWKSDIFYVQFHETRILDDQIPQPYHEICATYTFESKLQCMQYYLPLLMNEDAPTQGLSSIYANSLTVLKQLSWAVCIDIKNQHILGVDCNPYQHWKRNKKILYKFFEITQVKKYILLFTHILFITL